jgi:hypothetical protein
LWGLRGVERQVGQEKQDEVVDRSRCRVAAHNRSLHAVFGVVHHKIGRVTWLSHKTKTGDSAVGDGIWVHREALKRRTRVRIARLASRLREGRSPGIHLIVLQRHIPKVPLVGMYPSSGFRGILVFRLSQYILRGERMAAISGNPSSFGFPISPSYFLKNFHRTSLRASW